MDISTERNPITIYNSLIAREITLADLVKNKITIDARHIFIALEYDKDAFKYAPPELKNNRAFVEAVKGQGGNVSSTVDWKNPTTIYNGLIEREITLDDLVKHQIPIDGRHISIAIDYDPDAFLKYAPPELKKNQSFVAAMKGRGNVNNTLYANITNSVEASQQLKLLKVRLAEIDPSILSANHILMCLDKEAPWYDADALVVASPELQKDPDFIKAVRKLGGNIELTKRGQFIKTEIDLRSGKITLADIPQDRLTAQNISLATEMGEKNAWTYLSKEVQADNLHLKEMIEKLGGNTMNANEILDALREGKIKLNYLVEYDIPINKEHIVEAAKHDQHAIKYASLAESDVFGEVTSGDVFKIPKPNKQRRTGELWNVALAAEKEMAHPELRKLFTADLLATRIDPEHFNFPPGIEPEEHLLNLLRSDQAAKLNKFMNPLLEKKSTRVHPTVAWSAKSPDGNIKNIELIQTIYSATTTHKSFTLDDVSANLEDGIKHNIVDDPQLYRLALVTYERYVNEHFAELISTEVKLIEEKRKTQGLDTYDIQLNTDKVKEASKALSTVCPIPEAFTLAVNEIYNAEVQARNKKIEYRMEHEPGTFTPSIS